MPKISIIVPVYQAADYLEKCIDSILCQTFRDFELLLIDDGSQDESGIICDRYAGTDSRIRVIHKPNGGVPSARNTGLDNATGEYVMFCDSDDSVEPIWVEKLLTAISVNSADLGICNYYTITGETATPKGPSFDPVLPRFRFFELWKSGLGQTVWNKIFRKDIIDRLGLRFDPTVFYGEDCLFTFEYMKHCESDFGISSECTYRYRRDIPGSLSRRFIPNLWDYYERIHASREELFSLYEIDLTPRLGAYGDYLLWSCRFTFANYLLTENAMTAKEKRAQIDKIVKSRFFDIAVRYGDFGKKISASKLALKSRSTFLILLYYRCLKIRLSLRTAD